MAKSKYSWKEVKSIIKNTPEELKQKYLSEVVPFRDRLLVGYYHKSGAKWNYLIYVIRYKEGLREVVTAFGLIC